MLRISELAAGCVRVVSWQIRGFGLSTVPPPNLRSLHQFPQHWCSSHHFQGPCFCLPSKVISVASLWWWAVMRDTVPSSKTSEDSLGGQIFFFFTLFINLALNDRRGSRERLFLSGWARLACQINYSAIHAASPPASSGFPGL